MFILIYMNVILSNMCVPHGMGEDEEMPKPINNPTRVAQ